MSAIEYYLQSQSFGHFNRAAYFEDTLDHDFTNPENPQNHMDTLNLNCMKKNNDQILNKKLINESIDDCLVDTNNAEKFMEASTPFLKTLESADITSNNQITQNSFADFNYSIYNKPVFDFPYDYKVETNQTAFPSNVTPDSTNSLYPFTRSIPDQFFNSPLYISYNNDQPIERPKKRSPTITKKERRRTHSINAAFSALRNCIPNVPSDTKLSKIKTLRLATSYIAFLMNVIDKNDPELGNLFTFICRFQIFLETLINALDHSSLYILY